MPSVLAFPLNTTTAGQIGEQRPAPLLANAAAALGFNAVDTPGGYLIGQPMEIDTVGRRDARQRASLLAGRSGRSRRSTDVRSTPRRFPRTTPAACCCFRRRSRRIKTSTRRRKRSRKPSPDAERSRSAMRSPGRPPACARLPAERSSSSGATAQGLGDYATTAGRGRIPGIFANARFADQLMRGFYLRPAPPALDIALALVLPLLIALGFALVRTPLAIALSLAAALVVRVRQPRALRRRSLLARPRARRVGDAAGDRARGRIPTGRRRLRAPPRYEPLRHAREPRGRRRNPQERRSRAKRSRCAASA